jgi:hypothetical protein
MRGNESAKSPITQIFSSAFAPRERKAGGLAGLFMGRLMWLLVPLALLMVVVFGARYLIERMDGMQHDRILSNRNVRADADIHLLNPGSRRPQIHIMDRMFAERQVRN